MTTFTLVKLVDHLKQFSATNFVELCSTRFNLALCGEADIREKIKKRRENW